MPDLFHFNQPLAIRAGAYISRVFQKSKKQYLAVKASGVHYSQRKPSEDKFLLLDMCQRLYRQSMNEINKVVHPFDKQGWLTDKTIIKQTLQQSIANIEKQLIGSKAVSRSTNVGIEPSPTDESKDSLPAEVHSKLGKQVIDIVRGIESWHQWTEQRITSFINQHFSAVFTLPELTDYFQNVLLPWLHWQAALKRTKAKKRNAGLRKHYQQLIEQTSQKYAAHPITKQLDEAQTQVCLKWGDRIVQSFQRSSSQVEGRNGYLAFVHKANRGLPENRLQVLTVIHNFDIRREDGSTPAQRLFDRNFPNLFEHILKNVTGFVEPRKKRRNSLIVNTVQA
jgi:hypothetical protein